MIEYKQPHTSEDFIEENYNVTQTDGNSSLAKLWEIIVRTNRLPDGFSEAFLYQSIRDKLRDPEREVRQHALRVLKDLIPVTQISTLDTHMRDLLPEILKVLSHSSPSLRKGALDCLKKYLKFSNNYSLLMKDLLSTREEYANMASFLIGPETDDRTVKLVIDRLFKDINAFNLNQEDPAKALARIRYNLGDDRFKNFLGVEKYQQLQQICESYGLPIDYSDGDLSDSEKLLSGEECVEDKVILETEITLRTGPAITMKIHEESRPTSAIGALIDENDKYGVIKVLDDESESEFKDIARRTPRKVRFGGESVKLRTPESDSSNSDEPKGTLRITVTDAISITTKKSLIPIRITSLPSTPLKTPRKVPKMRLHQSAPNLSRSYVKTKLPVKRDSNLAEKFHFNDSKTVLIDESKPVNKRTTNYLTISKIQPSISLSKPIKLATVASPVPSHREIELFHNLTRSPDRQRRPSTVDIVDLNKSEGANTAEYNSFQLYPTNLSEDTATNEEGSDAYNSFTVCENSFPNDMKTNQNDIQVMEKINQKTESENQSSSNQSKPSEYIMNEEQNNFDSFKLCSSDTDYAYTGENQDNQMEFNLKHNGEELDFNKRWPISSLTSDETLWNKSEALDNLVKMLKQPGTCENLEPGPAALLFEALFACQHPEKLHFLADDALALMIQGLRSEVLDQCLGRLSLGICKIGAPSGVSLALLAMKKCPPRRVLTEIMERCFLHKTREGALQVLMTSARLLPRNELELQKMTECAAATLRDRRRRVRHAALETLATLAQLTSNSDVLDVVEKVTSVSPDHLYLLRVVRTRLSRRQLPTVELDGTIRYSTPRDQTELEWLSGKHNTDTLSASSSSSSSHSINYWKHNSRHDENDIRVQSALSSIKDESANGNQQIWAVDPAAFPRIGSVREYNHKVNPPNLRPVYILQPETVTESGRGYRRYDRGRSFSPPKPNHKQPTPYVTASTAQHLVTAPGNSKYKEGVRKSFSSEHLFVREKDNHEPYSFSLSSRSSTTSTGSSTKSNNWHKEMRSGIPVPISSETKFRLRTNTAMGNNASGPVIARRSALGSVPNTPVITRLSPRNSPVKSVSNHVLPPPPQSSGSESSGYFTPPPEMKKAFVKLESVDQNSESENKEEVVNDTNNNEQPENVDEIDDVSEIVKRNTSASSAEISADLNENVISKSLNSSPIKSEFVEKEDTQLRRYSVSHPKDTLFTEKIPDALESRSKSKSVADLQSFLPEISPIRKNINSAPLFKDDILSNGNIVISSYEEIKTVIPLSQTDDINKNPESPCKEITITRKLSRRLSRTQSKRSIKSTPRQETPSSSRVNIKSKETLQLALNQLNNPEWEVMIQGLQTLTRIVKYYPETIEGQMHTVCINLAKHIKNLRSQVARAACSTASELFGSCRKSLDMELEEIAGPLLHRTADTNKFLRADANAALDIMCEKLPLNRVISVIYSRGCNHQNSIVRSASIRLLTNLVKSYGADKIFQINKEVRDKIILAGANSLMDGSLEARSYGKEMFSYLIIHPQFQRSLLEVVPQNTLRHIGKTLNSIKPVVT